MSCRSNPLREHPQPGWNAEHTMATLCRLSRRTARFSMISPIKNSLSYISAGANAILITLFSHTLQEWNQLGSTLGIWLGVLIGAGTLVKLFLDIKNGYVIRIRPEKEK
jgi:hypothetical protein